MATHNKAIILVIKGEDELGEELLRTAIKISEDIGDLSGYVSSMSTLGQIMNERGDFKKADKIGDEIVELLAHVQLDLDSYADAYSMIYIAAKNLKNHQKALLYHEKYIEFKDSLINNANQKLLLQKEFDAEMQADSIQNAELIKVKNAELNTEKSENNSRKQQGYFLAGGLGLTLLFGLFVLNRYRLTKQQNQLIEEQKKVVEAAHEEIKDSITYAKRIQNALLPPLSLVKKYLPHSFVLYLPKDVVAGDFYWMDHLDNKTFIAAADCTGHGVPGAMVSVLCSNALSSSTREYGLTDPGEILNKTRDIIIEKFAQSEENVNDGMDAALVCIEKTGELKTIVKYAGANNPIWIIRKGATEVEEIKATKQPIGNYAVAKDFLTHTIELSEGDQFYLFSDGFADQFGGVNGKKLKSKSFREMLLSIKDHSADKQNNMLSGEFENWRGKFEQIDDVLVIGVRI
jgi:serine phosphatase RsbU (regulator of sigma subunit)